MINHQTTQVFFDDLCVPAASLIGEEGMGFRYILDGMNAERILIAAECIGDGYWFIDRAVTYAGEREVFGRPIGKNQGIQFPIARAYVNLRSADLMRYQAADLFDQGIKSGTEANMAKMLAADASWEAANVALQTHGGFGFARDFDIERKFRETRLYQVAPISTNNAPSPSPSSCIALAVSTQLSSASQTPSSSTSPPSGQASHGSPMPSKSRSSCVEFASAPQLSQVSFMNTRYHRP